MTIDDPSLSAHGYQLLCNGTSCLVAEQVSFETPGHCLK